MFRAFFGAGILSLATVAFVAPVTGQDSKKSPVKEKLVPIGVFAGKVLDVDEEGKTLKLRVYGKTGVPTFRPGNPRN